MTSTRIEIRSQVMTCTACALHSTSSGPIPFRGPDSPKIAIIGEAPGKVENETRKPFVGPSGKLAETWLRSVAIDPDSCAWLNAVSCFPDRSPTAREVTACKPNLVAQLRFLRPTYCLLFGGVALHSFWPNLRIGDMRGLWWQIDLEAEDGLEPWVMATWHPAAVLRNQTKEVEVLKDLARFRTGRPIVKNVCVLCKVAPIAEWDKGGCIGWCVKHSPSMASVRNKPSTKATKASAKVQTRKPRSRTETPNTTRKERASSADPGLFV